MLLPVPSWTRVRVISIILYIFVGVVLLHSGRDYLRLARSEPAENLRPLLPAISTGIASTIWVHPCSIAQVRSLPDPLPGHVVFGSDQSPPPALCVSERPSPQRKTKHKRQLAKASRRRNRGEALRGLMCHGRRWTWKR